MAPESEDLRALDELVGHCRKGADFLNRMTPKISGDLDDLKKALAKKKF